MAKLSLTDIQKTGILDVLDTHLDNAEGEGISAPSYPTAVDPMTGYTDFTTAQKTALKSTWKHVVGALIKVLGITGAFAAGAFVTGQTVVISYRKSDGVSNGTLTFTNGILVSST